VDIPHSALFETGELTVSVWQKLEKTTTGITPNIRKGFGYMSQGFTLEDKEYSPTAIETAFIWCFSGGCESVGIWQDIYSKWVFITTIYSEKLNKAELWINENLVNTKTSITPYVKTTSPLWLEGRGWKGTKDEVRIYNRALTQEEIQKLYYNGLENKFNITIGLFNSGFADLGNSFVAYVYLKNGTILQRPLILDNNLKRGSYLEYNLTIEGYYPSYGLVDKIMVCSNDCQGVCSEIIVNNQC